MNFALVKYHTTKCIKKKYDAWGNLIRFTHAPDTPGRKIDEYRRAMKKDGVLFKEKLCPKRNAVLFTWKEDHERAF